MPQTIVSFGEILWDLLPGGARLGGAPLNFALRAASLGDHGLIASAVGNDDLGHQARQKMAHLHVADTLVQTCRNYPTGTAGVSLCHGQPEFRITPGAAYDHIQATDELLSLTARADCLAFGTLAQRAPSSRCTLAHLVCSAWRALKLLDLNLREGCYSHETIERSLHWADVLKLSATEADHLSHMLELPARPLQEVALELARRYALECVIVTLGERGCLAVRYSEKIYVPGYRVEVVDTIGSGDAFAAGFIHHYLRQRPLPLCCDYGCALGAMVAMQEGATQHIAPFEIDDFIGSHRNRIHDPHLDQYAVL